MKYKQNRKLVQITESTLIVGADIARKVHVARAQDFRGIEYGRHLTFENTYAGFHRLIQWIRTLQAEHEKTHVLFGMEPTGHYWMPLAQFLRKQGIQVVLVNPMHVRKSKELDDNSPTKNDVKDAKVIAQLLKDGRYSEPNVLTGVYADLRIAMIQRDRLTEELKRIKNRLHHWFDRFFPEYPTVFKDWEGKASLYTLKHFPLPQDIVKRGAERIAAEWKSVVQRSVGIKRAERLVQAAQKSVGLTEGLSMARMELQLLLEQYELLCRQMNQLSTVIQDLLSSIPGAREMLSIPLVGWVTVAGFLSEVGPLESYDHPQQIIRLAGLNLRENSSGQHKGRTHITKRGRPRLRSLLFKAILPLTARNPEFQRLHRYLTTRPENPLKKMQSLIALCCKLIRVLFTLGKRQMTYDAHKMLGDIRRSQFQMAA
jgi:transposase